MLANNTEQARVNMAVQQVRPCDVIDDHVLDTMQIVPRERFVPADYAGLAFADIQAPIGHDQVMMCPRIEGLMLQALGIKPTDNILEIGTGSGFITACLAKLGAKVTSYDIYSDFTEQAAERLDQLNIKNVTFETANALDAELPEGGFDAIAVTGSLPEYDDRLTRLLANQGRMFVVIGNKPIMEATLITRTGEGVYSQEALFETVIPALENAPKPTKFIF